MDHSKVCHGSLKAVYILDSVDDNEAYGHIASRYHSLNDMVNHMDGVM